MAKKAQAMVGILSEKPSLEVFRESIKHVLMMEHGAPELVALALLEMEDEYIRGILDKGWDEDGKTAGLVLEVAAEIAIRGPTNKEKWILVEQHMVLLDTIDQTGVYLDALVDLGLYGDSRQSVARAMMARGIESVFHLLPPAQFRKR